MLRQHGQTGREDLRRERGEQRLQDRSVLFEPSQERLAACLLGSGWIGEPGMMPRDRESQREPAVFAPSIGESGPEPCMLHRFAASLKPALELRPILSQIVPEAREAPPLSSLESGCEVGGEVRDFAEVIGERLPVGFGVAGEGVGEVHLC
jgi:hypothetical protein